MCYKKLAKVGYKKLMTWDIPKLAEMRNNKWDIKTYRYGH